MNFVLKMLHSLAPYPLRPPVHTQSILVTLALTRFLSYQVRFQMHWEIKMLLNWPPQVRASLSDFLKFVGPSGKKITRTGNTAKYAGPGVPQNFLFVYFVLHRKSEMQLVCWNDHGQLGIRFYQSLYFYSLNWLWCINATISCVYIWKHGGLVFIVPITDSV